MSILSSLYKEISKAIPDVLKLKSSFETKEDGSYVSKGDLLVDSIIKDYFRNNFSSVQLISEETYEGRRVNVKDSELVVVVDPIDGTENFVSGLREWGIGVTIFKNGLHLESMMALPELNEIVYSGAKINRFKSRIHGLSSSMTKEQLINLNPGYEYRIIGCCMYNMIQVIKGSFAVFVNPNGAKAWDILPGLNIAIEHNLEVTVDDEKYYGQFLQPTKKYRFQIRYV